MPQELKKTGGKYCYACIQWTGQRTFYPEKKQIKVEVTSEGTCLMTHLKTKGSGHCEQYFPLR